MPFLVSIEGNIGAGKSTILDNLEKSLEEKCPELVGKILFLKEPLDIWEQFRDANGHTILQKFYADQQRYAFTFQVMACITRLSLLKNTIKRNPQAEIIILERSLCADKNIFMNMLHDDHVVEKIEFNIYDKWYSEYIDDYRVDAVVYMDSNPDTCSVRINTRNRMGEDKIPIEYLQKCRDYHTKWLIDTACSEVSEVADYVTTHLIKHEDREYSVLKIDSNMNTEYNPDSVGNKWLDAIYQFIREKI